MHLKGFPRYYVKGDKRKAVYYTADARELTALGWVDEEVAAKKAAEPVEEPKAEVADATEPKAWEEPAEVTLPTTKPLEAMTKAELVDYAASKGLLIDGTALKADIVAACRDLG